MKGFSGNPEQPTCFACNFELMAIPPIEVTPDYVLVQATRRENGSFVVIPGAWLILPRVHATRLSEVPAGLMAKLDEIVKRINPEGKSYNLSLNIGEEAGQTIEHLHFWVIIREDEQGLLSFRKGLATIIATIKRYGTLQPV